MVSEIEDLGSRVVNFITYNNDGHGIWDKASREDGLMEWLFAQKLEIAPVDTEPVDTSEATDETADTTPAASDTPTVTDTQASDGADTEKSNDGKGGLPIGAIIAIASAVVVIAVITIVVKLKEKK